MILEFLSVLVEHWKVPSEIATLKGQVTAIALELDDQTERLARIEGALNVLLLPGRQ